MFLVALMSAGKANGDTPMSRQQQLEAEALRIFSMPQVQEARQRLEAALKAQASPSDPLMKARVATGAEEIAFGQVTNVININSADPFLFAYFQPEHRLGGVRVPTAKYAVSNPDGIFRYAPLQAGRHYRLRGMLEHRRAAYFSLHLVGGLPGNEGISRDHASLLGRDLQVGPNGEFDVTIDLNDGPTQNHLRMTPETTRLLVRDTLGDWATDAPVKLMLECTDCEVIERPADGALASAAAEAIDRAAVQVLNFRDQRFRAATTNRFPAPAYHSTGSWAFTSETRFDLKKQDALAFTLDPVGAEYLGVQTADMLTGTIAPERLPSTLNHRQTVKNPDGTITFVLSPTDPGTANWLSTNDICQGIIIVRWQAVPRTADVRRAIRDVHVVPVSEVANALPFALPRVRLEQRRLELEQRQAAFQLRMERVAGR
jgi:hypothetical protein